MMQEEIKEKTEEAQTGDLTKSASLNKKIIKLTILLLAIGMFGYFSYTMANKADIPRQGDPAPKFELENLDGDMASLSDYEGKVVVLNYFATWCVPCVDEAPELEAFSREYGDKYKLLIIDRGETRDRVKKFIKKHDTGSSTYLFDYNSKVSKMYGVLKQPETFVIDKKGVIREYIQGPITKMELYNLVSKYE
ncbi:TlpA family protein disulfide reductase [Neobacillus piezotolerans]|uniref:TlpA family protein disulfide reductase n=1 Tax=Neobacillus piezotolerans TaxID=2259171 RepID=A0A3D8GL83_9BACI|nr:TlpA disulfide reductase family protein [Neobacillus piezotolerans]RDU35158.1 TlpA family protein disulfide reductase [Neobacillus piezotolerans]